MSPLVYSLQDDGSSAWLPGTDAVGGVKVVQIEFDFDTPDLVLTGIPIYTPSYRETLLVGGAFVNPTWASISAPNPRLHFGLNADLTAYDGSFVQSGTGLDLGAPATVIAGGVALATPAGGRVPFVPVLFLSGAPVYAMVDNGSGGDPHLTQGQAVVTLVIAPGPS